MKGGILPIQALRAAVRDGWIKGAPLREDQFQPASLDLRLGPKAYRIRCSFLPQGQSVTEILNELTIHEVDLTNGGILEQHHPYLIPLVESLDLPDHIQGRTNPKSSTGRLDVFTRVITDGSFRFEDIRKGYRGKLYLEVVSRSFTIQVKQGLCLNQLRLTTGDPRLTDDELRELYRGENLLFDEHGKPVPEIVKESAFLQPELFANRARKDAAIIKDGLSMSIDLEGDDPYGVIGYKAKSFCPKVDLTKEAAHWVGDYWESIRTEGENYIILEPEKFYIFASRERVRVPRHVAAEMVEYDSGSGELRTHYAGFFDPGFGYGDNGEINGTRAVLEVRAHDAPFRITPAQVVFKLVYERMIEPPEVSYGKGSHYQHQNLALSKHFTRRRSVRTSLNSQLTIRELPPTGKPAEGPEHPGEAVSE